MENGFHKKKQYGQNFLVGDAIPRRIAEESCLAPDCGVLEIGPGLGILTKQLAARAGKVVAVEIDTDLVPRLNDLFSNDENVKIIEGDIMKTDLRKLLSEEFAGMDVCVVANLPYYITSPILWMLAEGKYGFKNITVMVQKEVADRLTAKAGSSAYGAMTVSLSYYVRIQKKFNVSAGNFSPRPKVDSAVISLKPYSVPPVAVEDESTLFQCIRASFSMRRKTLVNGLASGTGMAKADILSVIRECGFDQNVRGEDLTLADFAALSDAVFRRKNGG